MTFFIHKAARSPTRIYKVTMFTRSKWESFHAIFVLKTRLLGEMPILAKKRKIIDTAGGYASPETGSHPDSNHSPTRSCAAMESP